MDHPPPHYFDYGSDDDAADVEELPLRVTFEASDDAAAAAVAEDGAALVVSFGAVAGACVKTRLQCGGAEAGADVQHVGKVATKRSENGIVAETSSPLYKVSGGKSVVVCIAPMEMAATDANVWAKTVLRQAGKPSGVVIAVELPTHLYRTATPPEEGEAVVRVLQSAKAAPSPAAPALLEPPNMLEGAAAAVLAQCQLHDIPARLYVSYRQHGGTDYGIDGAAFASFDACFLDPALKDATLLDATAAKEVYSANVKASWSKSTDTLLYI